MATIYLSSTYEDLKDHRRVVFEALRKSGYQVIAMEDYVATNRRPVEKCLIKERLFRDWDTLKSGVAFLQPIQRAMVSWKALEYGSA